MNFLMTEEIYPPRIISGIMGLPQTGKTLYSLEQGYMVCSQTKGNILFISTEEASPFFIELWHDIFERKYNVKPSIVFKYFPTIDTLLNFLGVKGKIILGGKNEFVIEEMNIEKGDFLSTLKKNNISYVVIDSITTVADPLMQGGRQNLPLRSGAEEILFSSLTSALALSSSDVYIFTTNHISFNPTAPFQSRENILYKGGKIIGHYTKNLLYIESRAEKLHGHRVLFVVRYPTLPAWEKRYELLIDGNGFSKISPEKLRELREEVKR
jgi:hypothetical protein